MTVSLVNDVSGERTHLLAVLYCDISRADEPAFAPLDLTVGRESQFRSIRALAAEFGGREAKTSAGGWAATFTSTVEALLCARALSSMAGWQAGGPSLSGGLSAGEIIDDPIGIGGGPVREAISLCRQALPEQILVADPLKVVVAQETARSFASAPRGAVAGGRRGRPLRLLSPLAPAPILTPAPGLRLRLNVLGWVQLEVLTYEDGDPPLRQALMRGSQARAVLSMLALRRGPVHKEELAELLWTDTLPDHWEGAIRGLITKIRRFLDDGGLASREVLVAEGGYYELHPPSGVTVDRDDATTLIADSEAALADGHPDVAAARARQAATILERRLLSGQNNTWFDQVRAELAHDQLAALDLCARADLAGGNVEGAKRAATEALALDPYRESSYRLLMQAHSAAGSRGEALRTYEQCRRMLAEELGVGPASQTQALYLHLLG
jgi:DNA-binding SARP family transcriptional activator